MLEKVLVVFIGDWKALFSSRTFHILHSFFILALGFVLSQAWPAGEMRAFVRPAVGPIAAHAVLLGTALFNMAVADGRVVLAGEYRASEWSRFGGISAAEAVWGKALMISFRAGYLTLSTLPVGLMAHYGGGLPWFGLRILYLSTFISAVALGWLGLFIRESFYRMRRIFTYAGTILYILFLALSYSPDPHTAHITPIFHWGFLGLAALLVLDMSFDLRSYVFG